MRKKNGKKKTGKRKIGKTRKYEYASATCTFLLFSLVSLLLDCFAGYGRFRFITSYIMTN